MKLYQIKAQYLAVLDDLLDNEADQQTITDTLESLNLPDMFNEKAVAIASFFSNLDAEAEAIKEAEIKMAKRRRSLEAKAAQLKDYLKSAMEETGITKISCPFFNLAIQSNPVSVEVENVENLPQDYQRIKTIVEADKVKIKAALQAGEKLTGCTLKASTRLKIT